MRHASPRSRIEAAETAGFGGIGLRLDDCRSAGAALRDLLDEHGMRVMELEHIWDWAAPVPSPVEHELFAVADRTGYRQLNVPMLFDHPIEDLIAGFGGLCDRAGRHGLLVGLEFMPYSSVPTLGRAWDIVAGAERENGGVIIDLWHWNRSGAQPQDLGMIDPDRVTSVQLCDVRAEPMRDPGHEARHHRHLPGDGAGDPAGVLSALRRHGLGCPVSVEVFSDDLDALSPEEAAWRAARAGASCLEAAGWALPPWRTNLEEAP
ncbi:sugar phosphate isomerase/epimerase family protein [Amycolatopsis sp. MEPSY49]|uniref:sugar phosphate isomerase/epimerase family protein n=1 Tax=Amycolatopsis sp. MEPSY49 TaxID=3151600 RepID=UPI003EF4E169